MWQEVDMTRTLAMASLVVFLSLCASGVTHAALVDNGGGLIYDTDRNITWYDPGLAAMTWNEAMDWAESLTAGGASGWRLPSALNQNGTGPTDKFNVLGSEMGHLYYVELGNKGYVAPDGTYPQPGYGLLNKGPFANLQPVNYWSSTEWTCFTGNAWAFAFYNGQQGWGSKADGTHFFAMAVHDGNVGQSVRSLKEGVLNDLNRLLAQTENRQDVAGLQTTIQHLRNGLAPALWIDANNLNGRYGEYAFRESKGAVRELDLLLRQGVAVQAFIDQLIATDRLLAQNAIDAQRNPHTIARAQHFIANANEYAIEQYGQAWDEAVNARR